MRSRAAGKLTSTRTGSQCLQGEGLAIEPSWKGIILVQLARILDLEPEFEIGIAASYSDLPIKLHFPHITL